jgi:hypothetical protein
MLRSLRRMMKSYTKPQSRCVAHRPRVGVEELEARSLMSVTNPLPVGGFTPDQIRHAYHFDNIDFLKSNYNLAGLGQTIAIVDVHDDPTINADLKVFDKQYGLPDPPSFRTVNETGGTTLPSKDLSNETSEIALDVEWAHAIAPAANILLVEASSWDKVYDAVDYARKQPGVVVVSMSWHTSFVSAADDTHDAIFATPAGHVGVTFVASAGDNGKAQYPSGSPNVLSVGGTTLTLDAAGDVQTEVAWSKSGGGTDSREATPAYQKGLGLKNRGTPDVAYDADPKTGFAIYDSSYNVGWSKIGGTSASAPQWAALISIADQGRLLYKNQSAFDGATEILPRLYQLPSSDFNDITSGANSVAKAGPGYDLVTGRGTPRADQIVSDLVFFNEAKPHGQDYLDVKVTPVGRYFTSTILIGRDAIQAGLDLTHARTFAGIAGVPVQVDIHNGTAATVLSFRLQADYIHGTFAGYVVDAGNHFVGNISGKDGQAVYFAGAGYSLWLTVDLSIHLPVSLVYHFQYQQIAFVSPDPGPLAKVATIQTSVTQNGVLPGSAAASSLFASLAQPAAVGGSSAATASSSVLTTTQAKPAAALTASLFSSDLGKLQLGSLMW